MTKPIVICATLFFSVSLGCSPSPEASAGGSGGVPPMPTGCPGLSPIAEPAEQLFVAPQGDDNAAGTLLAPLLTLAQAAKRLPTGGTILVRGGVYPEQPSFQALGTAEHPLVIRAATGETPVFDGGGVSGEWSAVLRLGDAQHAVIQGLEIRNCSAPSCQGISASLVLDLTVRECHIHHMNGSAARFAGQKLRLEGNNFHDIALVNENNIAYQNGGWPTCTGTMPNRKNPESPWTDDVIIRGNRIKNCWGEGIGVWYGSNVQIEGNWVDDAWNVGIYLDNSFNVAVSRNFVRMDRGLNNGKGSGITLGSESYETWGLVGSSSHDITIDNNVVSAGKGIGWWSSPETRPSNSYDRVSVIHNTVITTTAGALVFAKPKEGMPSPSQCLARDNLFSETGNSSVGSPSSWALSSNVWLNRPKPPIADATDVEGSANIGTILTPTDVKPLADVAGTGDADPTVKQDFICRPRDTLAPTRGAFEN